MDPFKQLVHTEIAYPVSFVVSPARLPGFYIAPINPFQTFNNTPSIYPPKFRRAPPRFPGDDRRYLV